MSESFQKDLDFINNIMYLSSEVLMTHFGTQLAINQKTDASIVTNADLASEKVILEAIRKSYPEDKIYSEEAGLSSTDRTPGTHIWIVDPLDGTTNFANRYPFFSVSIARGCFRADGTIEILAGGIVDPYREVFYMAAKGQGATRNGRTMQVCQDRSLQDAFLVTGFYYNKGEALRQDVERFLRIANECQSVRRDGSAALDLALVAEGVYDAFWEKGLQPWDVAAGSLLVTEAKGVVCNYNQNIDSTFNIEGVGLVSGSQAMVSRLKTLL